MAASLFISNWIENLFEDLLKNRFLTLDRVKTTIKPVIRMYASILRDERGILEPHADLLSMALAVIGFMAFATLMSQTYFGYEDRSFALENYESASLLANCLADDPVLGAESSGVLSASALDAISSPEGISERTRLFSAFSGNYRFLVEIRTVDGQRHWKIVPDHTDPGTFTDDLEKVAASVPLVIELNPAQSVPGVLTVVIYKAAWT